MVGLGPAPLPASRPGSLRPRGHALRQASAVGRDGAALRLAALLVVDTVALVWGSSSRSGRVVMPGSGTDGSESSSSSGRRSRSRRRQPRAHSEVRRPAVAHGGALRRPAERHGRVVCVNGGGAAAADVCAGTVGALLVVPVLVEVEAVLLRVVLLLLQSPVPTPSAGHTVDATADGSAAEVRVGQNRQKCRGARLDRVLRPRGNRAAGDVLRNAPERVLAPADVGAGAAGAAGAGAPTHRGENAHDDGFIDLDGLLMSAAALRQGRWLAGGN